LALALPQMVALLGQGKNAAFGLESSGRFFGKVFNYKNGKLQHIA
jgi:hypothetical protein